MRAACMLAVVAMATAVPPAAKADAPGSLGPETPVPTLVIRDSDALRIANARLRYDGDVLHLTGRICRRANRSGMEPSALDIDRISSDGDRAEHADAFLPRLSLRADQACGIWQTQVKGPVAPGDKIVVCVPRPRAHCRAD